MKKLVYNDINNQLIEFKIEKDAISIGRKPDNDLVLKDIFVSRNHCEIFLDNGIYYILDKQSKFGVFVNGEKIDKSPLKAGDEIKLGNTLLYFLDENDSITQKKHHSSIKELDPLNQLEIIVSSYDEEDQKAAELMELLNKIKVKEVHIQKKLKNYELMYKVGTMINSIFNLDVLLKLILSLAIDVTNGEFGFIFIEEDNKYRYFTKNIDNPDILLDKKILLQLKEKKKSFILKGNELEKFNQSNVKNMIISPLLNKQNIVIGGIYIGKYNELIEFNEETIEFLDIFSAYVGISIDNSLLFKKIQKEEEIKNNLKRYLSEQVAETIADNPNLELGGKEAIISVMFIDIRNFTPLSSHLQPQEVVNILNSFFTFTSDFIFKFKGTLDKFIGDCVMVIFGAPIHYENHADNAVKCALEIKKNFLKKFKKDIKKQFNIELDIGIGINSGSAIVGNIGTDKRMDYTAISDTVNVAERLESISKNASIYISEQTKNMLKDKYKITFIGEKSLKGKDKPVNVYEVLK